MYKNKMEPEPQEIWNAWQEWEDGDDAQLYDSGYEDGINESIKILKNVIAQPKLNLMPASFVVSVVTATLEETIREKARGIVMSEFNGDDDVKKYWEGVLDTCQYFKDELGIEDAMETSLAEEAMAYLSER